MTHNEQRSSSEPSGSLAWSIYDPGRFLSARDLLTEQQSRLRLLTRHTRYLHGSGVVCGLWVAPANTAGRPWAIHVCPGYAIGCCGEEIAVHTAQTVDIRDYLWHRSQSSQGPAYVGICYAESQIKPVVVASQGCGCGEETDYESSRILDAFRIDILWDLPDAGDPSPVDLCAQNLTRCPHCSNAAYVVLARINLPGSEGAQITRNDISH